MNPDYEDCTGIIKNLYAFHDNELSPEEADHIREHLMACEPCLDHYQVEDALRLLIKRSCGEDRAPETLRMRVRATYSETVIRTEHRLD